MLASLPLWSLWGLRRAKSTEFHSLCHWHCLLRHWCLDKAGSPGRVDAYPGARQRGRNRPGCQDHLALRELATGPNPGWELHSVPTDKLWTGLSTWQLPGYLTYGRSQQEPGSGAATGRHPTRKRRDAILIRTDLPSNSCPSRLSFLFWPEQQVQEQASGAGQSTTRLTSEYSQGWEEAITRLSCEALPVLGPSPHLTPGQSHT